MKIWTISLLIASAALASAGQVKSASQFCPASELPDDVLLNVCTHERGMAPLVQPRLYFRVYANGRAEYEIGEGTGLVTKTATLSAAEVQDLTRTLTSREMLAASDEYPAFKPFTDSSMETRLLVRTGGKPKSILLRNFILWDPEVASRYPSPIVLLMHALERYRDRAMGIVKKIPHYSFDTMVRQPDYAYNREIMIYADYEHRAMIMATGKVVNERDILFDHEGTSKMEVGMKLEGDAAEIDAMKRILARSKEYRFGGRGRILVRGRYQETFDPMSRERIRTFYAREVKGIEPIDLPYKGVIELGWNYADTINRPSRDAELKLSSPLKLPIHHYGGYEWMNTGQFPQVLEPGMRSVIFRASSRTTQFIEKNRWRNTVHLTILEAR